METEMGIFYQVRRPGPGNRSRKWELYAERGMFPDSAVEEELDKLHGEGKILEWRSFGPGSEEAALQSVVTVSEAASILKLSYDSLVKAAREGRIQARQSGSVWLTTIKSVETAIEAGTLRPREK